MPIDETLPNNATPTAVEDDTGQAGTATPVQAPPPAKSAITAGMPRGLIILLGVAAVVIVVAGMRAIPDIIGPVFLALILTIIVDPLRGWMIRRGAPRWLATLVSLLGVIAIVTGLLVAAVIGLAQLAALIPQYTDQIQDSLDGVSPGWPAWVSTQPTSRTCSAASTRPTWPPWSATC